MPLYVKGFFCQKFSMYQISPNDYLSWITLVENPADYLSWITLVENPGRILQKVLGSYRILPGSYRILQDPPRIL